MSNKSIVLVNMAKEILFAILETHPSLIDRVFSLITYSIFVSLIKQTLKFYSLSVIKF